VAADALSLALRSIFFKGHLLLPQTPRRGDKAAVVKNHCVALTDLMVKVRDDPVFSEVTCIHCGGKEKGWMVEVLLLDDMGHEPEGEYVFAMPVKWLQRVLPIGHEDASQRSVLLPA
jgi:hypothetical protein